MYLTPYLIDETTPFKSQFFSYPYFKEANGEKANVTVTLDMIKKEGKVYVLISIPSWERLPIGVDLPTICEYIFQFIEVAQWVKTRDNVFWYVLHYTPYRHLNQYIFKDEGIWHHYERKILDINEPIPFKLEHVEDLEDIKIKFDNTRELIDFTKDSQSA